eukprot:g1428.t1
MSSKYNGANGGVLGEIRATGSLSSGDNTTSNLNQVQNNHQMISNSSVKVSGGVNSNVNRQTMKNSKSQAGSNAHGKRDHATGSASAKRTHDTQNDPNAYNTKSTYNNNYHNSGSTTINGKKQYYPYGTSTKQPTNGSSKSHGTSSNARLLHNHQRQSSSQSSTPATSSKTSKSSKEVRRKKRNSKHQSVIPEIVEEKRVSKSTGEQICRQYIRGRYLGKGGFARCYLMTSSESKRVYAGKVVSKSSLVKARAKQKLLTEIKIHKDLRHKHVVRFERFFEDSVNVYILLELCCNQTMMELMKRRKRLLPQEANYYLAQMISALHYLHKNNIIHRDMKLGNLFLAANLQIKVGDLGLSAKLLHAEERKKTICGTPNYIAPEILSSKGNGHSFEVDIWSLGVILYTMLIGKPPFETRDVKTTYRRIKANAYSFPSSIPVSDHACYLIKGLLAGKPRDRPSLNAILQHGFFVCCKYIIPPALPQSALKEPPTFEKKSHDELKRIAEIAVRQRSLYREKEVGQAIAEATKNSNAMSSTTSGGTTTRTSTGASTASHQAHSRQQRAGRTSSKDPQFKTRDASSVSTTGSSRPNASSSSAGTTKLEKQYTSSSAKVNCPRQQASTRRSSKETDAVGVLTHAMRAVTISDTDHSGTSETKQKRERRRSEDSTGKQETKSLSRREVSSHASKSKTKNNQTARSGTGYSTSNTGSHKATDSTNGTSHQQHNTKRRGYSDVGTLRSMHEHLAASFNSTKSGTTSVKKKSTNDINSRDIAVLHDQASAHEGPVLWVTKWVDYTSKYGLGYLLNDGSVGVYFNDSSKIILANDDERFEYIERIRNKGERGRSVPYTEVKQKHTMSNYPSETLQKKVTLLRHFKNYLVAQQRKTDEKTNAAMNAVTKGNAGTSDTHDTTERDTKTSEAGKEGKGQRGEEEMKTEVSSSLGSGKVNSVSEYKVPESRQPVDKDLIFVKKWVRTRHAILFRISNRTVQVAFFDNTEIILSSEGRLVTYVDKVGKRMTTTLEIIMDAGRPDIAKRLKYTKEILYQLITGSRR